MWKDKPNVSNYATMQACMPTTSYLIDLIVQTLFLVVSTINSHRWKLSTIKECLHESRKFIARVDLLRCERRWAMIGETHLQITSVYPFSSCYVVFDYKIVVTVTRLQNPAQIKSPSSDLIPPSSRC